jgi:hypothetical protein
MVKKRYGLALDEFGQGPSYSVDVKISFLKVHPHPTGGDIEILFWGLPQEVVEED